jgi:hypothetical protein
LLGVFGGGVGGVPPLACPPPESTMMRARFQASMKRFPNLQVGHCWRLAWQPCFSAASAGGRRECKTTNSLPAAKSMMIFYV